MQRCLHSAASQGALEAIEPAAMHTCRLLARASSACINHNIRAAVSADSACDAVRLSTRYMPLVLCVNVSETFSRYEKRDNVYCSYTYSTQMCTLCVAGSGSRLHRADTRTYM